MKILVTGACGFAGRAMIESLLRSVDGIEIFGFDNLSRPGSELNRSALRCLGVRCFHGDLRIAADVMELPRADWVIEAAATPSVLAGVRGGTTSRQLFQHNLCGTLEILEYCRLHGAGLVLISTSRVYSIPALCAIPLVVKDSAFVPDPNQQMPEGLSANGIGPDFSTAPPVSLYGSSKLASEAIALEFGLTFGFPVWINRCGVLAGAGQFGTPAQGIFSFWVNAHLHRRPLKFIAFGGKGFQTRDAMHPADLAELIRRQIRSGRSGGQRIYTAGGGPGNAMSLAQLHRWCDERFGPHPVAADLQPRPFDVPWVAMDNSGVTGDFEWIPAMGLGAILDEIATHAESHPNWLEVSEAK